MSRANLLRVVTYNIHRCRGIDRKVRPGRIVEVLAAIDADIIALQEVLCIANGAPDQDQAAYIAGELGYYSAFGYNCHLRGGRYGNLLLTRFPIRLSRNYHVSWGGVARAPRGCLRADVEFGRSRLHVFNVHLGTGYFERRHQAEQLRRERILDQSDITGPRIVLGDLNEWIRGAASRLLGQLFESPDYRQHLKRRRTYPGILPLLHLDHIYFDRSLRLERLRLCDDRTALLASDHLPLVADFHLSATNSARVH